MPHTPQSRKRTPEMRAKIAASMRGNKNRIAGRDPAYLNRVTLCVRIKPETLAWLKEHKDKSLGALIDSLVERVR